MEMTNKKRAIFLGIRIGAVFLATSFFVIFVANHVLSANFHSLMTNYTNAFINSLTEQGVKIVEAQLELGRQEAVSLAKDFDASNVKNETIQFPKPYNIEDEINMVYVTDTACISSDGTQKDIQNRPDILAAFSGTVAIYGPYFNENQEYIICYSAPVTENGEVIGVLSIEKDGYVFCEAIENIQFAATGKSYIIDANGTDIAVSSPMYMDWVESGYNARNLYEEQPNEEAMGIMELEQKGLDGETGSGTYYWEGNLCHVFYRPIPSVNWVLLTSIWDKELDSITQAGVIDTIVMNPLLGICFFSVFLLAGLIIFWIVSNMKKTSEINERLSKIANYDMLTGLLNRNSYHAALDKLAREKETLYAFIFVDVNGLHELNNHLGHQAGDEMLKAVADTLFNTFRNDEVYRIGGDEFAVLCRRKNHMDLEEMLKQAQQSLRIHNYDISAGIAYFDNHSTIKNIIDEAEQKMQNEKAQFYQKRGDRRRKRSLDTKLEQILQEKQDADTFLSFLAPQFKGVYFVNLTFDTVRHIYIPFYFEEFLREANNQFSKALLLYARNVVKQEYFHYFEDLCDYSKLKPRLDTGDIPELIYQKVNGEWLKLRILKFKDYNHDQWETLWTFVSIDNSENIDTL